MHGVGDYLFWGRRDCRLDLHLFALLFSYAGAEFFVGNDSGDKDEADTW
jgi:hypothetical protein